MSNKNLLIFTDIGDDIDDSLALTYLNEHTSHRICAVIGSHWNIDYRVQSAQELFKFFDTTPPLVAGTKNSFAKQIKTQTNRLVQEIKEFLPDEKNHHPLSLCGYWSCKFTFLQLCLKSTNK